MKVYLVGGAVRDQLMGLPIKERDWVVVGADPEELLTQGYRQVGRGFPVFLHPETHEEYALARTEKKSGEGYFGFTCDAQPNVTLEEDLLRRDLTINAIAMDVEGKLIDPYSGQQDIRNKLLRHVSDAFVEDPVRILRVARFMARFQSLGFQIAPETLVLMQCMVRNGDLAHLVAERVWQEWQTSLQEKCPQAFLTTLRACGALRVIFPEIDRLFGVPNPVMYHPEIDSGVHTLMTLEVAAGLTNDPIVRFATLMHDLGKARTPMTEWPQQKKHEYLGLSAITELCDRLAVPKRYQKLALLAAEYHLFIHRLSTLSAKKIVEVLMQINAFKDDQVLEQLLLVCESDFRGRGRIAMKEAVFYRQAQDWRVLLAECRKISAQTYIKQGYSGAGIQDAMHAARIACIEQIRKNMSEFE